MAVVVLVEVVVPLAPATAAMMTVEVAVIVMGSGSVMGTVKSGTRKRMTTVRVRAQNTKA